MTDSSIGEEIRAFFDQYTDAFNSFDGKQIAALYYMPTVTMRGDGSIHCLQSREDLASFFQRVVDTYRKEGYSDGNLMNFEILAIGGLSALATMDWVMRRQDGSVIRKWRQSYNVARTPTGWKILVSTFHVASPSAAA